jgi:RES domain-containing protein
MRVWRISRKIYPPLDGEGARINGARWNTAGTRVAYTAGSLSLAIVELLVHTDPDIVPDDLVAHEIEIPESVTFRTISRSDLGERWDAHDDLSKCQSMGDAWLASASECMLVVPSAVVPEEFNYLINPKHPETARIQMVSSRPFSFDPRLLR